MAEGSAKTFFPRVQLACKPCHRAKLKCNRQLGCDQLTLIKCLKRSRRSQCVYTEQGLRHNTARQHAALMRTKLDRLEKLFTHLKDHPDIEAQLSDIQGRAYSDNDGIPNSLPHLKVRSLSRPAGNTYYISPSHWESILDHISDVKASFEIEDCFESLDFYQTSEPIPHPICSQSHFNIFGGSTKEDLLHRLPSKFDTDRLVGSWYNGIDPLRLIVHAPSFQIDYQRFWQDPISVDTQWLAMLFAIATAGAEISGQIRDDAATLAMADKLRIATAHAIQLADCTTNKRWLLETLLVHARAYQLRKQDTDVHVCLSIGFSTRLAIMAGLHLDSSHNTALSPYVCEMRRRIWASVCEHDISASYQCGAFSAISRTKSDALPPANVLDTDFSREMVPSPRPLEDYTPALHQAYCSKLIWIFADIVHASENLERSTRIDTDALYCRLIQVRASWPQVLRLTPFDQGFTDSNELVINRYNLEFVYLKADCVLYRPYLGTRGAEEKRCLSAAEDLVRKQLSMLEHAQPGSKLASSTVFLKHFVHDFNLATMLLCLDVASPKPLTTEPDPAIRHMRLRTEIIKSCNLWLEIGVPSRKARHALNAVLRVFHSELNCWSTSTETAFVTTEVDHGLANDPLFDGIFSPI